MTTNELRTWLFEKNLPDQWWACVEGVTEDEPLTLTEIDDLLIEGDFTDIKVLHLSRAEKEHPVWIPVELEPRAAQNPEKRRAPKSVRTGSSDGFKGCLGLIAITVIGIPILLTFCSDGRSSSDSGGDSQLTNSSWDSSVGVVEKYLSKTLKDPDSYEGIEWSEVQKLEGGKFRVRHKYRAKNSFGGYVIENQIFLYDQSGEVLGVFPYGDY